jgi:hypothetical protein
MVLLALACVADDAPQAIAFAVQVHGENTAAAVNAHGATVELTRARACVGRIETHAGEAVLVARAGAFVDDLLSIARARAHPGHYDEGGLMGEVDGDLEVDLLGGVVDKGTAAGISGHHGSAALTWCALDSGAAVELAGEALVDGERIFFTASAPVPDDAVVGIAVDVDLADGDVLDLGIDVFAFVDRVDFAAVAAGTAASPTPFAVGSQADNAVGRALRSSATFVFSRRNNGSSP